MLFWIVKQVEWTKPEVWFIKLEMTGTGQNRPGINQNPTKTDQESCMNPSELARKRAASCTDSFQCMIFRGFVYINQTFWQFSRIIFVFTNITGIKEAHSMSFLIKLFYYYFSITLSSCAAITNRRTQIYKISYRKTKSK